MSHANNIPENAPEHCPGVTSVQAGKSDACQGCPNQILCASGKAQEIDPDVEVIRERLVNVKYKVLVLSGKGGVGKSTFTGQLSFSLADSLASDNLNVGVMDIDICGPSLPQVFGVADEQVHSSGSGWSPVFVDDNLSVMSVGFLLSSADEAVIWRGPKKNGLIKQFLRDVDWGELEYLVIDTPPGTSDEHLSIAQYLKAAGITGVIVITTPQEVSLLDVRKEITFCKKVNLPIIGVIENMSGFTCLKCNKQTQIFPPTTGGAQQMCKEMQVDFLGKIPLDPRIGQCSDEGKSFTREHADSPGALAYKEIIQKIKKFCESSSRS